MSNNNVVRTSNAGVLQTCQYVGKPLKQEDYTTLNQKLNIHVDQELATSDNPSVKYVVIGNGGHTFSIGGNGKVKFDKLPHKPQHSALYNQLPFVLRTLDNDLMPSERARYRLRRLETHGGVQYIAYYARVLDLSTTEVARELRTVVDGVTTSRPYVPSIEDLSPVPPVVADGAVTTTGDYIAVSAKVPFVMSKAEVDEFVSACRIITGEDGYAVISEMATVSGVDRSVSAVINGNNQTYLESICSQITSFIQTAFIMEFQTKGITLDLDVGNVEPLAA